MPLLLKPPTLPSADKNVIQDIQEASTYMVMHLGPRLVACSGGIKMDENIRVVQLGAAETGVPEVETEALSDKGEPGEMCLSVRIAGSQKFQPYKAIIDGYACFSSLIATTCLLSCVGSVCNSFTNATHHRRLKWEPGYNYKLAVVPKFAARADGYVVFTLVRQMGKTLAIDPY
jgi:hypothetical protein